MERCRADASEAGGEGAAGRAQRRGLSLRAIARQLGRAASTISRELRRNLLPKVAICRPTPRAATSSAGSGRRLWSVTPSSAASSVSVFWRVGRPSRSPAGSSVARSVGCAPSPPRDLRLCPPPRAEGREALEAAAAWAGQAGRRRARQPRSVIAERRSIHDRPEAVQERKEAGHWRGTSDLQADPPGAGAQRAQDRFVLAARLAGKSAAETVAIMMAVSGGSTRACARPSPSTTTPPLPGMAFSPAPAP